MEQPVPVAAKEIRPSPEPPEVVRAIVVPAPALLMVLLIFKVVCATAVKMKSTDAEDAEA